MGLAMLAIMLYHQPYVQADLLLPVSVCGLYGVDVFFFLSGMGIACSLRKNDIRTFYGNRFWRLVPTWFLAYILTYAVILCYERPLPLWHVAWWGIHWWFLRTLVIYYVVSPWCMKCLSRLGGWGVLGAVAIVFACLLMLAVLGSDRMPCLLSHSLGMTLEHFPSYLLGLYVIVGRKSTVGTIFRLGFWAVLLLSGVIVVRMWLMCGWEWPFKPSRGLVLCVEPLLCPLVGIAVPAVCYLMARLGKGMQAWRVSACVGCFGVVSLELYLWHEVVYMYVSRSVSPALGELCRLVLAVILSLLVAWGTRWLSARFTAALRKRRLGES